MAQDEPHRQAIAKRFSALALPGRQLTSAFLKGPSYSVRLAISCIAGGLVLRAYTPGAVIAALCDEPLAV